MKHSLAILVTTSPCWDWVICAPAAFLGCGSRFSGSLSGIEPSFPVTRKRHGSPLLPSKADRQKLDIAAHKGTAIRTVIMIHQDTLAS